MAPGPYRFDPLIRDYPASWPKKIRFISTPKEVEEIGAVQSAIAELWPKGQFQAIKGKKTYFSHYKANGWDMDLMTYDQDPDEFEGPTIPLIIFNEPPPEDIYKRCVSRTRMGGKLIFPMTPLTDAAWIKDKLVDRADGKRIVLIGGDVEDACIEHGINGHLKHANIQNMIAEYDPDEYEARVHGKFMHLSGLVYRQFNRGVHVWKDKIRPVPGWPKIQVIDPSGLGKPFSVLWAQVCPEPKDSLQVFREWPDGGQGQMFDAMKEGGMTVDKYVELFRQSETDMGTHSDDFIRIMDRRFGHIRDPRFGRTLREHFGDFGYFFQDSYSVPEKTPEVETGIQVVKNYLRTDTVTGRPFLIIGPDCVNTIRAFERWGRDPQTGKVRDDVWKNFMDIVRYLCAAEPKFEQSMSESEWNDTGGMPRWN